MEVQSLLHGERLYLAPFGLGALIFSSLPLVPTNFDYDSVTQEHIDRRTKAELVSPVYEFIAPVEYMLRPPQPPAYLFLIDVTFAAVNSGTIPILRLWPTFLRLSRHGGHGCKDNFGASWPNPQ